MPSSEGVSWLEVVTFTVIKVCRHYWKCCCETTIISCEKMAIMGAPEQRGQPSAT